MLDLKTNHDVGPFEDFERKYDISIARLLTCIMRHFATPNVGGSIYRFTQFISDYIKKAGIAGIRYQSSVSAGYNITIFHRDDSEIQFVSSKVIFANYAEYHIVDLNSGKDIKSILDMNKNKIDLFKRQNELVNDINMAIKYKGI